MTIEPLHKMFSHKLLVFRLILVSTFIALLMFGAYGYWYHTLATEGWYLFNDRCSTVNPLLIKTSEHHMELGDVIAGKSNSIPPNQLIDRIKELVVDSKNYLQAESSWLNSQKNYINRSDFKILEPNYIKEASLYQVGMYQVYYDYYEALVDFFDYSLGISVATDSGKSKQAFSDFKKRREDLDKAKSLYFESFEKGTRVSDWRKLLGQVPPPACKEEDLQIP